MIKRFQIKNDKGKVIKKTNVFNKVAEKIVREYGIKEENPKFWELGSIDKSGKCVTDAQGFDVRAKRIGEQKYIIESEEDKYPLYYKYKVTFSQQYLGKGTELIRYGRDIGHYTALSGTEFNQLGLPYIQDSVEFHRYRVLKDTKVVCIEPIDDKKEQQRLLDIKNGKKQGDVEFSTEGIVAPAFGSFGGAIQYYHDVNIRDMIKNGVIEEV